MTNFTTLPSEAKIAAESAGAHMRFIQSITRLGATEDRMKQLGKEARAAIADLNRLLELVGEGEAPAAAPLLRRVK